MTENGDEERPTTTVDLVETYDHLAERLESDGPAPSIVSVSNLAVDFPERWTGGGDRFDAAMAVGLASGWDFPLSLAAGNAAASYYVATGETGDAEDLAAFVRGDDTFPSA